ncbi:MAG: sulfatase [Rhizobiales bacterium]|nr:sulfatase [Hyphomicrobiales bacterium]
MAVSKKPNVIYVFADQLRASSVGCYGEENVKTPNIDVFAKTATMFPVAVASPSICGPYRAVLVTGLNPLSNGVVVNDIALSLKHRTIGEVYAENGYDTAYIGKWHLDGADRLAVVPKSRRRGFRYWAAANFEHNYLGSKYYKDEDQLVWEGYDAEAQVDEALKYLRKERRPDMPFCLFLSWGPPHNPYRQVPQKYLDMYDRSALRPRQNSVEFPVDDIWGYYAQITFLDEQFERLLEEIDALDLSDETIVVFTSDHGDMHGSHGVYKKGWPWDESIRVPFLIRQNGRIPKDAKADFPISTMDIMPTLLGLCDLPIPSACEGVDCSSFILGRDGDKPASVLVTNPCPTTVLDSRGEDMVPYFRGMRMEYRGVRTMRHTYIETIDGPWLLFDNLSDPYQLKNLIDDRASAKLRQSLAEDLRSHLAKIGDEFLPKEVYYERFGIEVDRRGVLVGIVPNPYPANL